MSGPDFTPARALLSSSKLSDLLKPSHVVTIKQQASVDQALRVLASHRILSAPVLSSTANDDAEHHDTAEPHDSIRDVAGFIDIRDILSSFLQEVNLTTLGGAKMLKRMRILEEEGGRFASKAIGELKSLGSDGWFYNKQQAQNASLREIVYDGFLHPKDTRALFGGTRSRQVVHRLALFGPSGELTHVVSQSDVIGFVYNHLEDLGSLADATTSDLGFVTGAAGVVSVSPDTPALDAMVLMEDRNISAVAVVSAKGGIIGNFSISELRSILAEHFGSLALPVGEFLALEHGTEYAGYVAQREEEGGKGDGGGAKEQGGTVMEAEGAGVVLGSSPQPSAAAFTFAANRDLRRRESRPGSEVGQNLITCAPDSTVAEILDKLVHNRLHRVYVVDEGNAPCGVITLTDILRKLVEA